MTIDQYKKVIFACNDTILLAKQIAKDYVNTPIIIRHAQQMILNASSARAAVIEDATKEFPYISWLNVGLGSELKSDIDLSNGKSKKRDAKILELMPNKATFNHAPHNGN